MDESYHGIRIKLLAAMSALGGLRYRRFWFEVVLAASGASNKGVWGVYGCALSWWFPMTQQFIAGEIKFFPLCRLYRSEIIKKSKFSPMSTIAEKLFNLFIYVIDTTDKFFAGVSADNTSLPINLKMKNKQKFNLKV
jgi:hypothetical protein